MFNKNQAQAKMQEYVNFQNNLFIWNDGYDPKIIIYEHLTEEKSFGWIFYWQVQDVKDDYSNVIVGNGPVIIEKETLDMYKMGTGKETEFYVEKFIKDKNSLAKIEKNTDGVWDITNLDS